MNKLLITIAIIVSFILGGYLFPHPYEKEVEKEVYVYQKFRLIKDYEIEVGAYLKAGSICKADHNPQIKSDKYENYAEVSRVYWGIDCPGAELDFPIDSPLFEPVK